MKAYTISEYFRYISSLEISDAEKTRLFQSYIDFVSQAFAPDHVLLFAGFALKPVRALNYKYQLCYRREALDFEGNASGLFDVVSFTSRKDSYIYQLERGSSLHNVLPTITMCYPSTLHDFISDCCRMGIPLNFKEDLKGFERR